MESGMTVAIVGATLLGVALGRWPGIRADRATICLIGAAALLASGVLTLEQAFAILLDRAGFAQRLLAALEESRLALHDGARHLEKSLVADLETAYEPAGLLQLRDGLVCALLGR